MYIIKIKTLQTTDASNTFIISLPWFTSTTYELHMIDMIFTQYSRFIYLKQNLRALAGEAIVPTSIRVWKIRRCSIIQNIAIRNRRTRQVLLRLRLISTRVFNCENTWDVLIVTRISQITVRMIFFCITQERTIHRQLFFKREEVFSSNGFRQFFFTFSLTCNSKYTKCSKEKCLYKNKVQNT